MKHPKHKDITKNYVQNAPITYSPTLGYSLLIRYTLGSVSQGRYCQDSSVPETRTHSAVLKAFRGRVEGALICEGGAARARGGARGGWLCSRAGLSASPTT